jgi:hypothetical protein
MTRAGLLALLLCGLSFGALAYVQGCGGDDDPARVSFQGNVDDVELPASAALGRAGTFALLRRSWSSLVSSAIAQSGECSEETQANLEDVFLCVGAAHEEPTPTDSAEPEPTPIFERNCVRVNAETCEFRASIRLRSDHDFTLLVFSHSPDGDADNGDAAFLSGYEPTEFCNGDVINIPDVDIDFDSGTATPGGPITKEVDACESTGGTATPTRSATRTRTPTGGPHPTATPTTGDGTPVPTVTGTPPTATPTGGSATPTVTPTIVDCSAFGGTCGAGAEHENCCAGLTCVVSICLGPPG